MNQREMDFLKLENELLTTRKKLNELIYEYQSGDRLSEGQANQEAGSRALYQDKINFLETELMYLRNQLQLLKGIQSEVPTPQPEAQTLQPATEAPQAQAVQMLQEAGTFQANAGTSQPTPGTFPTQPALAKPARSSREYEKLFGKNFMGIFASALIFVSLIIFATLVIPYLNDTMKLLGLYILSFGILGAGLLLYRRHRNNKFYIAVIGCGIGSLYISLLLSDLYFKVIGDIILYGLLLVWAVLVKVLTRLKNLVFQIIGHIGIFIATVLGTVLCVSDGDMNKFFVLTIFYLLSACIFSDIGKENLRVLLPVRKGELDHRAAGEALCYEKRFCSHISRTLNCSVFLLGYLIMAPGGFKVAGISLLVLSLLFDYYVSYRETCNHGFAFQVLTCVNALLLIGFFHATELLAGEYTYVFMYLTAVALLFYVGRKDAGYGMMAQICSLMLAFIGCVGNQMLREHLYAYLTVTPCLIYGKRKDSKFYLYAGIVYLAIFWALQSAYEYRGYGIIEYFVLMAALCAAFLYACRKLEYAGFKMSGYALLSLIIWGFMRETVFWMMKDYNLGQSQVYDYIDARSRLIAFFVVSILHLVLSRREYFGREKLVDRFMLVINGWWMLTGCLYMSDYLDATMLWKLPTILITVLLFLVNSGKLLPRHKYAGYYIAFKYTVLMLSILGSFQIVNYVVSICLLLFAIVSIVVGFYRDNVTFRLYGLILSIISVIKLILIDIHYDSTLENAISFFVCGVLCFIISFIYHKIDIGFKKK